MYILHISGLFINIYLAVEQLIKTMLWARILLCVIYRSTSLVQPLMAIMKDGLKPGVITVRAGP